MSPLFDRTQNGIKVTDDTMTARGTRERAKDSEGAAETQLAEAQTRVRGLRAGQRKRSR